MSECCAPRNSLRQANKADKVDLGSQLLADLSHLSHLPPPKMTSLISLRAISLGLSLSYLVILALILSLTISGMSFISRKPSRKYVKPESSSMSAKSFKVTDLSSVLAGRSISTFGPYFYISTMRSSSYSLWTSKCSIIILWHNLLRLSQYCQLYMWWLKLSSLSLFIWTPYLYDKWEISISSARN